MSRPGALLLWLLLVEVVSCGGNSVGTPRPREEGGGEPRGGSRLRALYVESEHGIGVFRYYEDTKLGLNCHFTNAEAGTFRCLPAGPAATRATEVVFADAACTEPHVALSRSTAEGPHGCTPPRHVVVGGQCGTTPAVFEIGPGASAVTRYRLIDGTCSRSDQATDALSSLFALTPMPLDEFERARPHAGDETQGIVPLDLSSDDGAYVRSGFRDAAEGFDCRLVGPDEVSHCVPTEVGLLGFAYADAACTEPAAMLSACSGERAEILYAQDLSGDVFHRGGARLDASYTGSATSCALAEGNVAFAVGPEISVSRFASGRQVTHVADELAVTVDTVGSASMPARDLESRARGGHACFAARGADGELRCMPPPERYLDEFFADPTCTQRVETTQSNILAVQVPDVCPPQVRVYARGERHSAPVYAVDGGTCTFAHERPPNDSGRSPYYVFPTELPASEFALLFEIAR
jgi:hypothetical protein